MWSSPQTTSSQRIRNNGTSSKEDNTAVRNDALRIASTVNNTITTQNAGIIAGLYLVRGEVINSGRNVRVVYRWDKKSNAVRPVVRGHDDAITCFGVYSLQSALFWCDCRTRCYYC
jgi:hypothetical protein